MIRISGIGQGDVDGLNSLIWNADGTDYGIAQIQLQVPPIKRIMWLEGWGMQLQTPRIVPA